MVLVSPLAICVLVQTAASSSNLCDSETDYHALFQTASPKYLHRTFGPSDTLPENEETPLIPFSSMLQLQQRAMPSQLPRERASQEVGRQSVTPVGPLSDDYGFSSDNFSSDNDSAAEARNTALLSTQLLQHAKAPSKPSDEFRRFPDDQVPLLSDDRVADGGWAGAGNTASLSSQQLPTAQAPEKRSDEFKQHSDMRMHNLIGDYVASSGDDMSGGARTTALSATQQSQHAILPEEALEVFRPQERDNAHVFGNDSVADDLAMRTSAPFMSTPQLQRAQSPDELEFRQQAAGQVHFSNDGAGGDVANGLTRPNLGKGPDTVHFGILVKQFYGVDLETNTFTVDMISTIWWSDPRAAAKVPAGVQNFTMSESQAKKAIWIPRVAVTNRDIRSTEDISTSFSIHTSGEVHRVCRQLVKLMQKYRVDKFPFDSHDLEVRIASSKYMSDEVVLVPSANVSISGISSKTFEGEDYYLRNWRLSSFEDDDGDLRKSRGLLNINVKREPGTYFNNHMVPCILLMLLSCSVFWFPFVAQFVTPRVALSILAVLTLQTLTVRTETELPSGHPQTWDDIINQNIMLAMVINCVMNVYTEIHYHVTKVEELAKRINTELKYASVLISSTLALFIYIFAIQDLASHGVVTVLCKICLIGSVVVYIVFCERRVRQELLQKNQEASAQSVAAFEDGISAREAREPREEKVPWLSGRCCA